MKRKILFAALVALAIPGVVFGQSYKKPGSRDVVLVVKVVMNPRVDDAFYSKYWGKKSVSTTFGQARFETTSASLVMEGFGGVAKEFFLGSVDAFSSESMRVPKERTIDFYGLYVFLASSPIFQVNVPMPFRVVVPEGVQYLYLGTLEVSWTGIQYEITNVRRYDEYDAAQKVVTERFGPEAKLVRAVLKPLEEEEER